LRVTKPGGAFKLRVPERLLERLLERVRERLLEGLLERLGSTELNLYSPPPCARTA
jgi:hypothetical protein